MLIKILIAAVFGVPIGAAVVGTFLGICWMDAQRMQKEASV